MLDVLIEPIRKTFVYSGRTTRMEYWGFMLPLLFVWFVLCGVEVTLYGDAYLGTLYMLVAILPILSLSARRLHDTGQSGFWVWFCLIFTILIILFLPPNRRLPLGLLGMLFYYLVKKSEPGANKYGSDPHVEKRYERDAAHRKTTTLVTMNPTSQRKCKSCGKPLLEGANFCTSCGTAQHDANAL